jgi:hypothetical protein
MHKYLFAGLGSLVMTGLLFSFVIVLAGATRSVDTQHVVVSGIAE